MCDELPSSLSDVDKGLAEIDWMMGRLRVQRRRLRTRHNAAIPISRLPVEILMDILRVVAFGSASSDLVFPQSQSEARLLRLTHVCTHWRDLAVGTPSLWTTPPFQYPYLAKLYLQRSLNQPLSIIFPSNSETPSSSRRVGADEVLAIALSSHWSNIRDMALMGLKPADIDILQTLTQAAPQLRMLILELDAFDHLYFFNQKLLAQHAPLLRSLHLKGCIVAVDWPPLASLVSLELETTRTSDERLGLGYALSMLEHTPALEHLSLRTALDPASSLVNMSLPRGRVRLPRLRQLTFYEEELLSTLILLTQLRLPEGLHTCISAGGVHPVPRQAWTEFFAFLKDYPSVSGPPPIRNLRISATEDLMQIIDEAENAGRGFRFEVFLQEAWFSWIFVLALDNLPLANLTHITVGRRAPLYDMLLNDVPTIEEWLAAFSNLPSLQTICIEHDVAFEFGVALHTAPEALAYLHTLSFIGADLTSVHEELKLPIHELLVDAVEDRRRSMQVTPLRKLLLSDCICLLSSQRTIKEFGQWVDEVIIINESQADGFND
jgi:hypothetical protein